MSPSGTVVGHHCCSGCSDKERTQRTHRRCLTLLVGLPRASMGSVTLLAYFTMGSVFSSIKWEEKKTISSFLPNFPFLFLAADTSLIQLPRPRLFHSQHNNFLFVTVLVTPARCSYAGLPNFYSSPDYSEISVVLFCLQNLIEL